MTSRRQFLATCAVAPWLPRQAASSLAAAGGGQPSVEVEPAGSRTPFVTFDEPGFPVIDGVGPGFLPAGRAHVAAHDVSALAAALRPGAVLVWRHGAAFPAEAWPALLAFLEAGGSWVQLGGAPFTRPVVGRPGARHIEPLTLACTHALRLNQVFDADVARHDLRAAGGYELTPRTLPAGTRATILEPRLTDTRDEPAESGSPGAREAMARSFAFVYLRGTAERFPVAAAAWALDRLRGRFAGGRWTFWTLDTPPSAGEWALLRAVAAQPPFDLRVEPTLGCFHDRERPSVEVRLQRAADHAGSPITGSIVTVAAGADREPGEARTFSLGPGAHTTARIELPGTYAPGLHHVRVDLASLGTATTGFWVFDPALFASGAAWTHDAHVMRRDGHPAPLMGTTFMSSTVHRDFLFAPDASEWDASLGEIASLGMNVVRTGLWSGWRRIMADGAVVDDAFLRALEAYYLTARSHGLAVVFSAFAFAPEGFGSGDPYFDPRALEGQRALLAAIARRFAPAREFLWDLINEPSMSHPGKLWMTRPSRSTHEAAAFERWLAARFAGDAEGVAWDDVVRRRWRLAPGEAIGVPADEDFDEAYVFTARHPYRAADYTAFTHDAFAAWARSMRDAIRAGGSTTPITVGQDEGGLTVRPSPATHQDEVEFTSMHTWWNNDALLWDTVAAKVPARPLIVSETGVMLREHLSRAAVRGPADTADLLSRKLAYALAGGASGVIQWCYDVNPLMDSDNEVHIGLKRVDGSVKPEHRVVAGVAAFVTRNAARFDGYVVPEAVLIVPSHEQHTPRDLATGATRRLVRMFSERLGIALRGVDARRAAPDLGRPRLIVLPSCRGIASDAWRAIARAVDGGATLACSGWFETDDAGFDAVRVGGASRPLAAVASARELDGAQHTYRFGGTLPESWVRSAHDTVRRTAHGAGSILHHPLPIDWADTAGEVPPFYEASLAAARLTPPVAVAGGAGDGHVLACVPFAQSWLLVAINEGDTAWHAVVSPTGRRDRLAMDVPAGRAAYAFVDPVSWTVIDRA